MKAQFRPDRRVAGLDEALANFVAWRLNETGRMPDPRDIISLHQTCENLALHLQRMKP